MSLEIEKLFEKHNIQKNGGYLFNVTGFIPLKKSNYSNP